MKNMFRIVATLSLLTAVPGFTKEVSEFPSRAIRPILSNLEADRAIGQTETPRNEAPRIERPTSPTPRHCARPYNARDEGDANHQRECPRENGVQTQSDIPQLRPFRQPSTQRFAP
jgi:hypothetical protein